MPKPEPFDGMRGVAAKQWFELVLAYIAANETSFHNDQLKMSFVLTSLKPGTPAMAWVSPI